MFRPTVAEIDLDNIIHNIKELTCHLPQCTKTLAVVKADGYGHGSVEVAKAAIKAGVGFLAVALVEEGIQLRESGIKDIPILILGFTPPSSVEQLEKYKLTPTIYNMELAKHINETCKNKIKVHIKVDTGMNRLGIQPEKVNSFLLELAKMDNIDVEGIFTHYATADERDNPYSKSQFHKFKEILKDLPYKIPIKHIANSAGVMENLTDEGFDMVRLGIAMYGLYPSHEQVDSHITLKPALSLKTRIAHIKTVDKGTSISYGITYKTKDIAEIATLPLGYADGYFRSFSNKGYVFIHGKKAPVVGRVCMDYIMVDVTAADAKLGDEVIIYAREGENTVDNMASLIGTINYELVCAISKRVPRIYKGLQV
ncbi:alanine racemase [Alkalicella caledoniensis]|uniref:Alanine racemase n=1 Tax=Alkalicella caledoniensis TaxID=2731377 RepID=A0A7G9W7B0_ALKCA|nr:alanine racemase [Alkalicella caledoniensis]QNO14572.1 alanine racemase [Alkalicella caledoniensis]